MAVGICKLGYFGIAVTNNGVYNDVGNGGHKLVQSRVAGVALAIAAQGTDAGALDHLRPV